MFTVKINQSDREFKLDFNKANPYTGKIDTLDFLLDVHVMPDGRRHVLWNNQSYTIEIVNTDYENKKVVLKINGKKTEVSVKDKFDLLLKEMGIDVSLTRKVKDVKAPMPGLVLDVIVSEGCTVATGEPLIVLEAMKMENIIKSPVAGTVKKIHVSKTNTVDKNQVLLSFE